MKKAVFAASLFVLSGCATTSVMNGIMSSWEGSNIDSVVSQWGYPHERREFNGRTLYVWQHNKSAYLPATTTTSGTVNPYGGFNATSTTTGGYAMHGACTRTLEVDGGGRVVGWQWGGNNCPFMEAMEYRHWRNKAQPK